MDQAMVKRGIGAVVLAIIAALLLGYLLKDKSRERQEVVDMKLPDTTEMHIPDLSGSANVNSGNSQAENTISIVDEAVNTAKNMKNSVLASADAVTNTVKNAVTNIPQGTQQRTTESMNNPNDPGFSIRPPSANETREIVDNRASDDTGSAAIAYSTDPVDEVIASSEKTVASQQTASSQQKVQKKFKPTIVEEKKPRKQAKPVAKKPTPATKTTTASTVNKPLGKYSIQLLATSSQSRAAKLAKTMRSEGYKVFITQTRSDNKTLFRVRVGGYADRTKAVKAQEGMKRRYQKNFFVQNSLVISN